MRMTDRIKSEILLYVVTAALALLLLVPVLRLDRADLSVPLSPGGDATFYQGIIAKPLMTQPWYVENPDLSAPAGLLLYDYPTGTDSALYLVIKILAVVTRDAAVAINIFYLMTYPLAALTMLFAARYLRLRRVLAVAVGLLFAFTPYHLFRGEAHLTLSAYFMLPIGLVIAIGMDRALGDQPSSKGTTASVRWRTLFTNRWFLAGCAFSVLVSVTGVYYAFFYGVTLMVIAARRAIQRRTWASFVAPAILGAVIVATVVASALPTLVHQSVNGANPAGAPRSVAEAEIYALRPVQLIMPIMGHRIPPLNAAAVTYNRLLASLNPAFDNESRFAALGVVASLGFGFLLAWSVLGLRARRDGPWTDYHLADLATINITMLLLGTVGGVGFLIAATITPLIRAYNRVSIVIAMVALLAVGAVIDRATRRFSSRHWLPAVLALALLGVGILDQAPAVPVQAYAESKAANRVQREFGASIERYLPAGAKVFQLPYVAFPGAASLPSGFGEYDLLLPYIYSDGLKWSFGAMQGRPTAAWQKQISALLPVPAMLAKLKAAGFSALYLDRRGYTDGGTQTVSEIEATLGRPGVESSDGRMLLWRIDR